jgi:hypothetical protein
MIPDFEILSQEKISAQFLTRNISDLKGALQFIKMLLYGRNSCKENILTVFTDGCGTCSTKHALIRQLAVENNFDGLKLFIGIYRMTGLNTPAVKDTLHQYHLEYLPEAHCYLKFNNEVIDITAQQPFQFAGDLVEETEIMPDQITGFKVGLHKKYLSAWLNNNRGIGYSTEEIWTIREKCILDLTAVNV